MTLTAGRVLSDRYQVDELLGAGGMASVWRGRDLRLDRPVAIKELSGPWLRDPTAMTRFDREARTAARLAHPNIVAVHDVGADGDSRYLVMELVEGTTVAALIENDPLPIDRVIAIAAQTCDALTAAHDAGVIHRDIKPANLIVTADGVAKICDFGIARALSELAELSITGPAIAMGSTSYMAPEQVAGEPIDGRADLYSLGCTMYAMLTGAPPFTGDTPMEVLERHLHDTPVPVLRHRADAPTALAALVGRLLAKDPADRPATAGEVKSRLLAVRNGQTAGVPVVQPYSAPIGGPDPAPNRAAGLASGESPRRSPRRSRRWLVAALSAIVAAMAVTAVVLLSRPHALPGTTSPDAPAAAGTGVATTGDATPGSAPGQPAGQPATSAGASGAPPPSVVPPSATGPVPTTPAPPTVDPVTAIRRSISELVATADLQTKGAEDLGRKVDEYVRAVDDGKFDDAAKRVREMRQKLSDLQRERKVSPAGYERLSGDIDRIAATLPA
jgi:serine/threonine-protein kinase